MVPDTTSPVTPSALPLAFPTSRRGDEFNDRFVVTIEEPRHGPELALLHKGIVPALLSSLDWRKGAVARVLCGFVGLAWFRWGGRGHFFLVRYLFSLRQSLKRMHF